jgi:hypothetical protein
MKNDKEEFGRTYKMELMQFFFFNIFEIICKTRILAHQT